MALSWQQISQSYRRSFLGPFWITANLVIFTLAMSAVYGSLFNENMRHYTGYIACGMMAWVWISSAITAGGNAFQAYAQFIQMTTIDKSILIWAMAFKHVITLLHHLIVYAVLVAFGFINMTIHTLMAIPSIIIIFIISIPITATISTLYIRYRDLEKLATSLMIIIMLTTPILWKATQLRGWRTALYDYNPVYYIVEFLRRPLLGEPQDPLITGVVFGIGVISWIFGSYFYNRYQRYCVFWI